MACVSPDGKPTQTGKKVLQALRDNGVSSAEKVAETTGVALFRVRSGLRDMVTADLAEKVGEEFKITEKGIELAD
ncbi:MAG: hypothetical protein WC958_05955 [Dehalococcoidales bacterium]